MKNSNARWFDLLKIALLLVGVALLPLQGLADQLVKPGPKDPAKSTVAKDGSKETDVDGNGKIIEEREYDVTQKPRKLLKKVYYEAYHKNGKVAEMRVIGDEVVLTPLGPEVEPVDETFTYDDNGQPLTKRRTNQATGETKYYKWVPGHPSDWKRDREREKEEKKKKKKEEGKKTSMGPGRVATGLAGLCSAGKIQMETAGTGETIGHVADLLLHNRTKEPLTVAIPALVIASGSGKNQHYAAPFPQTVEIAPGESKTVPVEGVCLVRSKPPVGKGVTGDLIVQDPTGTALNSPETKTPGGPKTPSFSTGDCVKLLNTAASYYLTAAKLQKEGAYKDMPYSDPRTQKNIAVEWGVWCDPQIAKVTGSKPATKEDLAKIIYKQAETKGPVVLEKKKKLDQGISAIWDDIQLTGKEAKNLADKAEEEAAADDEAGLVSDPYPRKTQLRQQAITAARKSRELNKKADKIMQEAVDKLEGARKAEYEAAVENARIRREEAAAAGKKVGAFGTTGDDLDKKIAEAKAAGDEKKVADLEKQKKRTQ